MDEQPEIDWSQITQLDRFHLFKVMLEKLHSFRMEEIDADIANYENMDVWARMLAHGKWLKLIDLQFEVRKVFDKRYTGKRGELRLIEEKFGEQLDLDDTPLPSDVADRLEWYQRNVARRFAETVRETIKIHEITSPVEQLFLMAWKFAGVEDRFRVTLRPQHKIECAPVTYSTDFAVLRDGTDLRIAIEIDGHDFHEKTRAQVAKDKARERAIIAKGYTVLRFTGTEIVRDTQKCVNEVVDILTKREP